jgi:filamentous hemagglutinin
LCEGIIPSPTVSKTESRWVNHQTALTGGSVDIYVENKTTLKGAVIASDTDDLKFSTGSFEYSDIKDKDISYNFGGGLNLGTNRSSDNKKNEGNNNFSVSASYGFSEKRQTNFATIGNGEITVRDGKTDLSKLKRDVTVAQYGTVDVGLKGQMLVDSSTVDMFKTVYNLITDTDKTVEKLQKTWDDDVNNFKEGVGDVAYVGGRLVNNAGMAIERTSNWLTTDKGFHTNQEIQAVMDSLDITGVTGKSNGKNIHDFLHDIYGKETSGKYDNVVASETLHRVAAEYGMTVDEFRDRYSRGLVGDELGNETAKYLNDNIDLTYSLGDYNERQKVRRIIAANKTASSEVIYNSDFAKLLN